MPLLSANTILTGIGFGSIVEIIKAIKIEPFKIIFLCSPFKF